MEYSRFIPKLRLQSLIDCYWIVEGTDESIQKVVPDGFPELIFHFGDAYGIYNEQGVLVKQARSIAAGQLDRPIVLRPSRRSGVLGIKFRPAGLWQILKEDMTALTNQACDLAAIAGKKFSGLAERLQHCASNNDRIFVVESFLEKHMHARPSGDEIDGILDDIERNKGQVSINDLSVRYSISKRKIERVFLQRIGISAKLYARLTRFKHVYHLLQQPAISRAEASYLSGYFDQAHFNRDFRQFTNENPEVYFRSSHALSNFFLNK